MSGWNKTFTFQRLNHLHHQTHTYKVSDHQVFILNSSSRVSDVTW